MQYLYKRDRIFFSVYFVLLWLNKSTQQCNASKLWNLWLLMFWNIFICQTQSSCVFLFGFSNHVWQIVIFLLQYVISKSVEIEKYRFFSLPLGKCVSWSGAIVDVVIDIRWLLFFRPFWLTIENKWICVNVSRNLRDDGICKGRIYAL